ncbi:MAG: hypothetical protein IJ787_04335 [Bacilli bacterium]|nr:hypothetical protein [Bacilli bacterium]
MKVKRIASHAFAIALALLPLLLILWLQPWFLGRQWATIATAGSRFAAIWAFYTDGEYTAQSLTETVYEYGSFPKVLPPINWEELWEGIKAYFSMLATKESALEWLLDFSDFAMGLTRVLMIGAIAVLFLVAIGNLYLSESGKDWRENSALLQRYRRFSLGPCRDFLLFWREWGPWFRKTPYFYVLLLGVALLFGLPAIAIDLIVEYLHFFSCFSFAAVGDTIFADVITLLASYLSLPLWLRLPFSYVLFRALTFVRARKLIEGKLMPANEAMVDNDTGVFTLILGKMRGGKTTLAASMGRILNTIYHKNAFDNMDRCSMMFPEFPWAALEKEIVRLALRRRLVNMDQCAALAMKLYEVGSEKPFVLYGYDVSLQKTSFVDGANEIKLVDAMAIYAESYWVYFQKGNLIASNFPIRTDDIRLDKGHLVLYDTSLFKRKVKDQGKDSSFSRVLVFDMLRLGRKMDPENRYRDANGPMIAVATEFGKEEGNMVSNTAYSAKDATANPKNDLLDYSLKLGGHLANIWHTNFFKFIADEQRSGSLTSNLVSVAQSIFTADRANQKEKMALKLFHFESMALDAAIAFRAWFCTKYRHNREDGTLLYEIINKIGSFAYRVETLVYMTYGYKEVDLPSCTADASGNLSEGEKKRFYIINKIDYAARFESACMKDFLNARKAKADYGFFDIPTYKKLMPDKKEWDLQGSYLVSDLENPERKFSSIPRVTGRRAGPRRQTGANRSSARNGGDGR